MAHTITGRVHEAESDQGVAGLSVTALVVREIDGNTVCCGTAGTVETDDNGRFRVDACGSVCSSLSDPGARVTVEVRSPDKESVLATGAKKTGDQDRYFFDFPIGRRTLGDLSPADRIRPGAKLERVAVKLTGKKGEALKGRRMLLVTEHKARLKRQRRIVLDDAKDFEVDLAPGQYTVQAFVEGYSVAGGVATVEPGKPLYLDFPLVKKPAKEWKLSDAQRLGVYGFAAEPSLLKPLVVEAGETVVLDGAINPDLGIATDLTATTIDELKKYVGSKDLAFAHDQPRFASLPTISPELTAKRTKKAEFASVTPQTKQALEQVAHEYVYGNASSVQQFQPVLDGYLAAFPEGVNVLTFRFSTITIKANGTLIVGRPGSTVLFASVLKIHPTGKLKPVGNLKVDVGRWAKF